MLRTDVVKLCQEDNFNTGFFEGNDNNITVDAYELKVIPNFFYGHPCTEIKFSVGSFSGQT